MSTITQYLFTFYPSVDIPMWQMVAGLAIGGLSVLGGVFMSKLAKVFPKHSAHGKGFKKVYVRTSGWYFALGLVLLILTWLQLEKVPFLGMQICWWMTLFGLVVLEIWNLKRFISTQKRIAQADARRAKK